MAIWSTSANDEGFNARLHEICFKTNLDYDNQLLPWDIIALISHGRMLAKCALISNADAELIETHLQAMKIEAERGVLKMTPDMEDCHSLIEDELIRRAGDAGKQLYMARSRNDQVVSATRLFGKDRLLKIKATLKSFIEELLDFSARYETTPMPGYTHTQRAMPSSVGLWASSFVEILLNQKESIDAAIALNDVNVLGSAAGYGTDFPIDRDWVTEDLGLAKTQVNSLSAQLSRGQVECQTLQSLWGTMFVINRLANDLVWMTSAEFDFFDVAKSCTTGSSIMPNKKNLDPCEIIRSRYHLYTGRISQAQSVISNLFSGYNSDYQETKGVFMEGLTLVEESLEAMGIIISNTTVKKEQLLSFFSTDIYATDLVNRQVIEGKTFRDAYIEVKKSLDSVELEDPHENIKRKTHVGAPGNPGISVMRERLANFI